MIDKLLGKSIETNLDDSFLLDVNENLSKMEKPNATIWNKNNRPPISLDSAFTEYDNGIYTTAMYIYVELLCKNSPLREQVSCIDSLLDNIIDLDKVYQCLDELMMIVDNLCRNSYYDKGIYLMGIAQSVNNIMTREFNPKYIAKYPTYIKLQKIILKYFKLSVKVLMGCNLELEFDVINTLNLNLAKMEINYGIILTSPYITAIPECKAYKVVGDKALRLGIARLNLLFKRDIDKKYLILISQVLKHLGEHTKSEEILIRSMKMNENSSDFDNISIMAKKKRDRSYKHKVEIYTE